MTRYIPIRPAPPEPRVTAFEVGWITFAILFASCFVFYAFWILVLK